MELVEQALGKLDLDTKAALLAGQDMWTLPAVPEIGLASLVMSDGPIGVRGPRWTSDDPSIALPSPTALAATWDVELARRTGALLAQEARRKGVHVLLAPTVNLHRSPLGGRHFECYSEDPLLTGEIAAGYVRGVQERGVAVTVKHFVANDFETERMTADVLVGDRALRELYLAPFETVVAKASPYGIMCAYNSVNGPTMSEHDALQNGVLRGEWGFDGFIVSDWLAARDTIRAALGGLDVAMPGPRTVYGPALARAVRDGDLSEDVVDEHVRRVLRLALRTGALVEAPGPGTLGEAPGSGTFGEAPDPGTFGEPPDPSTFGEAPDPGTLGEAPDPGEPLDGAAFARELAARSCTLLTNDGLLPFAPGARIALIGGLAKDARVMGGGSAAVYPAHVVSPLEGLRAAGLDVVFARGADPSDKLNPAADDFELTVVARDTRGAVLGEFAQSDGSILWLGSVPVDYDALRTVELRGTFTPSVSGAHRLAAEGVGQFRLSVGGDVAYEGALLPEGDDPMAAFYTPPQRIVTVELTEGEPVEVSLLHHVLKTDLIPMPFVAFTLAHKEPTPPADDLLAQAEAAARLADVAVIVVGTSKEVESEGFDRLSLRLPGRQDELVARVAAANPRTVVVVNAGSPVEMPWRDDVAAVLLTWFPGQEGGHALADVLTGAREPGGRLPTTWPVVLADCPVIGVTPENGRLAYDEGIFIGYRAWDRHSVAPAYPFGHGLGYTTWAYESAAVDNGVLTVTVRNTGERAGREVVQAFLSPAVPDEDRPIRWLAGFAVAACDPGRSVAVEIEIPERAFQTWTPDGWRRSPGDFTLSTGGLVISAGSQQH